VAVDAAELELGPASAAAAAADVTTAKNVEVLNAFAAQPRQGKRRTVALRFQLQPAAVLGEEGRVTGVRFERTRLEGEPGDYVRAVPTGEHETLPAQLVLKSVGYTGVALAGLPFDERRGVVPNERGRVLDGAGGAPLPGLYVAGWIKRGASGVIGTNKADAMETVASLLEDLAAGVHGHAGDASDLAPVAVDALLSARGVRPFDAEDWFALDAAEVAAGEAAGRPRVKAVRRDEMLSHRRGR